MHGFQWLELEGLLRMSPDIHLLCLFGMTHKQTVLLRAFKKMVSASRLMPFRPLFPCVPWSRGTNNITLK